MLYILSQVAGWLATAFRAGGMLAKDPMKIKMLVSVGNAGWLISGVLTGNIPLIVSNGICLVFMVAELVRGRK